MYGLNAAPEIFVRVMFNSLQCLNETIIFEDILITGKLWGNAEHNTNLVCGRLD